MSGESEWLRCVPKQWMHELWKEPMQRSMNSMKSINSHSMKLMELMIELKKARRNEGNEIKSFQFTPNGEMKLIDLHAVMKKWTEWRQPARQPQREVGAPRRERNEMGYAAAAAHASPSSCLHRSSRGTHYLSLISFTFIYIQSNSLTSVIQTIKEIL